MTEAKVREVFSRRYSGGDLNEALMESMEELALILVARHAEPGQALPDIVKTIVGGRSRIGLFAAMFAAGIVAPAVPMSYILHFDHIRKAMLDAVNYMHDNYDTVQPWFREKFTREALKMISGDMSEAIEKPTGLPGNVRGINFNELNLEEEFFTCALIGIMGVEPFKRYADEYNLAMKILRQCQAECKLLETAPPTKES